MRNDPQILTLYLARRGDLLAYAHRIVGDRAAAEDVVQEAYLRVGQISDTRPLEDPLGYLYRVVRNLALDDRRRMAVEIRLTMPAENTVRHAPDHRPSPETEAVARDDVRCLSAALAKLPERARVALEMHRLGGCKLREIGSHFGISTTSAHELVVSAVEHCRRRMQTRS